MKHFTTTVVVGLILIRSVGCTIRTKKFEPKEDIVTAPIHPVHYLTWVNYDGYHQPEKAIYIFDGEGLGCGDKGFQNLLLRLSALATGTSLNIFPVGYYVQMQRSATIDYIVPFNYHFHDLAIVAHSRNLKLDFSNIDQNGVPAWPKSGQAYEGRILK